MKLRETSVDNMPSTKHDEQLINYLNPDLFKDIRVLNKSELEQDNNNENLSEGVRNLYSSTFTDISENSLLEGRVVGMNERDVLIDIGFKSEGIIDRNEFNENELPKIGDQVEVYLESIEDASGNTISKEKLGFCASLEGAKRLWL